MHCLQSDTYTIFLCLNIFYILLIDKYTYLIISITFFFPKKTYCFTNNTTYLVIQK